MTVLVAHQGTEEGRHALARAIAEARLRSTDLVVLAAPPPGVSAPSAGSVDGADPTGDLAALLADAGDLSVQVRTPVRPDHLADELVDLGTELNADLIVIGLRRRSPVGKLFFGSIAQDVLLGATVPVLSVRLTD